MTTANSNTEMMNDSRFLRDCCIDKEAFDEYLADKIPSKMKARMDKYMEGNEEEPLNCMRFGLENPTDRKGLEYSVCMLVDCDGGYMPIFNTGINTSSYFALWSCGIDRDYDDEDEIPKMTINEIAELCCEEYRGMFVKMCEQIERKSYKIEKKIDSKIEDKTDSIKLIDPQKIDSNPKTITEDKIIQDTKMTTTNTATINGLTYNISTRMGECGANKNDKKTLYFPFFLLGTCGDDRGVISWNGVRERLVAPKKMNAKWFELIANKLKQHPNCMFDWDWESFTRNILEPNREHIKTELGISDEKVDRLLQDGYVFLNSFKGSFEEDGEEMEDCVEGVDIGYYPNFANFLKYDNLEY